ncbi:carbohydrate sulfotransferase 4-like [Mixophyes fleayi]|uniref:carbohydrate sulfotransferase 4-like n=1 Tax=Mixophyes fleayi TaxID=3061075 RepID=UPI003F4DB31C
MHIRNNLCLLGFTKSMLKFSAVKFTVLMLMTAQGLVFMGLIMKWHDDPPSPANTPNRTHILILSTWRSGSSFTGQLFSQHPNVFYLMEPAWHVWDAMKQNSANVLHMAVRDLVRSVFLCDMSVFDAYMPENRIKSALFQWETSRALCSPPACHAFKRSDIISQLDCKMHCDKYAFNIIEKTCKTYSHIVQKEVRFFDLKVLYPLLKDPTLNLKILHLVRDPRAVFQSRKRTTGELSQDSDILIGRENNKKVDGPFKLLKKICDSQVNMYQLAVNGNFSRLSGRYLMIRYEDIVDQPIEKASQIYQFGKLNFTPKLKSWVYNLTHGIGYGNHFVISSRDAVNVSKAWRTSLQFEIVQRLQDLCGDAMEVFGYKVFQSEEEQKDLQLSSLLPMPDRDKISDEHH